jgi:hypothetical protein
MPCNLRKIRTFTAVKTKRVTVACDALISYKLLNVFFFLAAAKSFVEIQHFVLKLANFVQKFNNKAKLQHFCNFDSFLMTLTNFYKMLLRLNLNCKNVATEPQSL